MLCTEVSTKLAAYVDGELKREEVKRVEEHLSECQQCAEALSTQQRMREAFKGLSAVSPPADFAEQLMTSLASRPELAPVNCDELAPLLSAYADAEVSFEDETLVEDHLAACEPCAKESSGLQELVGLYRALPRVMPPSWLSEAIFARTTRRKPLWARAADILVFPQPRPLAALAAMAAAALVLGLWLSRPQAPSPIVSVPTPPLTAATPAEEKVELALEVIPAPEAEEAIQQPQSVPVELARRPSEKRLAPPTTEVLSRPPALHRPLASPSASPAPEERGTVETPKPRLEEEVPATVEVAELPAPSREEDETRLPVFEPVVARAASAGNGAETPPAVRLPTFAPAVRGAEKPLRTVWEQDLETVLPHETRRVPKASLFAFQF